MSIILDVTRAKSEQTPDETMRTANFIRFNDFIWEMDALSLGKQKINLIL